MIKYTRIYFFGGILLSLLSAGCSSSTPPAVVTPTKGFTATQLVANNATYSAGYIDVNLQDAWGLAVSAQGGFWIADRARGSTTVYDSLGTYAGVLYNVNAPGGTQGSPTGIVQNTTQSFPVGVLSSTWIFSQLNGTLAAIPMGATDSSRIVSSQYSASSSFTGLALVTGTNGAALYVPNVKNGSLDEFDQNFNRHTQLSSLYPGYTPFNAVLINTQLFITSAKMSNGFVATGAGNGGYVDIYDLNGNFKQNLISGGMLDEPWGVAIAPASFGNYSGKLLVGNFGDGKINAFDPASGAFFGTLSDASGNPIIIPGLWALVVHNGLLYYTAGPNGGTDGVFGKIALP